MIARITITGCNRIGVALLSHYGDPSAGFTNNVTILVQQKRKKTLEATHSYSTEFYGI